MIEKRFTYDKPMVAFAKAGLNDNLTGKTHEFTVDEILDLLNELHEENQSLKQQLKNLRRLVNEAYMEGSE